MEPIKKAEDEKEVPVKEEPPVAEEPVAENPIEEPAAEPVDEVIPEPEMKESVPDGIGQQMAALREQVSMLAEALELLRNGSPEALADAADAAEVICEVIEQEKVTEAITGGSETGGQPEDTSDIMMMRKELEALKAENAEFKKTVGAVVEKKEEVAEVKQPIPPRRGVVKNSNANVEIPGFSMKEMINAANNGQQTEYFREKFKLNRKIVR